MTKAETQIEEMIEAHKAILPLFLPEEQMGVAWVQGYIEGLKYALEQLQKD